MEVVCVADLWKKFKIPHERRTTILENIAGALQMLAGKTFTYEEFWVLKEVSFHITSGESLGVIGENGSGKSTLLKILAKILRPDRGKVETNGRIAPILELGVGFHPELTAKENILVYGTIMGLKNSELKKRLDPILQFADLERFRDAKLKNLSSGMQMRLGFSVAIETDPDIFLIDEALAVGDFEFQQKCLSKFKEFKNEGKTIILVSHALNLVKEFCEKTLLLSRGEMISFGETEKVVNEYLKRVQAA
jgi:lipopolysaccharide transport system ATP-binding protein